MAFYARSFIFDGIPSEVFGLIITSSDSGEGQWNASSDVEIKTEKLFRRPVPYFYGTTQTPVLEFEAQITTTSGELTAVDSSLIQKWLFGKSTYKKLRIVQPDMEDIYYNCFLTNPQINRVGNIIRGFTFNIVCDSPFAWKNPKSVTYTVSNRTYTLYNESDNNFYTYPKLVIDMDGTSNGSISIKNVTDNNNTFAMTGLPAQDVITVDCDLQIVTDSLNTPNLLNKLATPINFLRLLTGTNQLFILGNIDYVKITYTPMKRVG